MANQQQQAFVCPDWADEPASSGNKLQPQTEGRDAIDLDTKYQVLGRDESKVTVTVPDRSVSRLHAALVWHKSGKLFLIDLGGSGGTFLDGEQLTKHKPKEVKPGSTIGLGEKVSYEATFSSSSGSKRQHQGSNGSEHHAKRPRHDEKAKCRHILIKHKESRRPKSWKEDPVTRTKEEAESIANDLRQRIKGGESFEAIAKSESHCNTAGQGGDLGEFGRGKMMAEFDDVVFNKLRGGELSHPVHTQSGVHLILKER